MLGLHDVSLQIPAIGLLDGPGVGDFGVGNRSPWAPTVNGDRVVDGPDILDLKRDMAQSGLVWALR